MKNPQRREEEPACSSSAEFTEVRSRGLQQQRWFCLSHPRRRAMRVAIVLTYKVIGLFDIYKFGVNFVFFQRDLRKL